MHTLAPKKRGGNAEPVSRVIEAPPLRARVKLDIDDVGWVTRDRTQWCYYTGRSRLQGALDNIDTLLKIESKNMPMVILR